MIQKKPSAVFLSDFHIGENLGGVSDKGTESYTRLQDGVFVRKEFLGFLDKLDMDYGLDSHNKIKYLVIMGDQWDLAVKPMPYSMNLSLGFFDKIGLEEYFEEIIYIPGNHDHHIWRMYQTQKCVIDPLNKIKENNSIDNNNKAALNVETYPQEIPGYLDLTEEYPILKIDGLEKLNKPDSFVSGLTGKSGIPINVVYPNLYILYNNEKGVKEAALATHGHLFDPGWNIVTDLILPFFKDKMGLKELDLKTLEMLNSPVTEAWNYGFSQLGQFNIVDTIYDQLLEGKYPEYITDLINTISAPLLAKIENSLTEKAWFPGLEKKIINWSVDELKPMLFKYIKEKLLSGVGVSARYDQDFIINNKERVEQYIKMSSKYISELPVNGFSKLIFGHTHVPLFEWQYKFPNIPQAIDFYNTGGWVDIDKSEYPLPLTIDNTGYVGSIEVETLQLVTDK